MNKEKILNIVRLALPLVSFGLTFATDYFKDKDLDEKISKKVTEALANAKKGES
jgi:hypothetical protein